MKIGDWSFSSRERGAVLLLFLMVLAVLIVVVGQFSYTAALDYRIAWNHQREAQLRFDELAGVEAAMLYASSGAPASEDPADLSIETDEGGVLVRVEDESGKFNVNSLLAPPKGVSGDQAESVLRRLLASVDDPAGTMPAGLADGIVAFVKSREAPLPTLDSLQSVEGVTPGLLWGDQEEPGLSRVLTAYGDGRVRPGAGDRRVLLALAQGLDEGELDGLLALLQNPGSKPPPGLAQEFASVSPWMAAQSSHYLADVRVQRDESEKRARAVIAASQENARVVRFDEVE